VVFGQHGLYGPYRVTCGPTEGWAGVNCAVTGDQTLKITAAVKTRHLRDRNVDGNAWFSIGAGYKVDIIGGGADTSECTKDETVASFPTNGDNAATSSSPGMPGRVSSSSAGATSASKCVIRARAAE
jgi:hypothetical protein